MAFDVARESADDHVVADLAPRLRSGRDAWASRPQALEAAAPPRSHPARRGITPPPAQLLATTLLALALAACNGLINATRSVSTPSPLPVVPTEAAPGQLHMIAEPAYDSDRVELDYVVAGERIEGESIDEDVEIIVNRQFPPGHVQVVKNATECDGSIEIASNMETDVLLDFGRGDSGGEVCEVVVRESHAIGSIRHPELPLTAAVGAFLPRGIESVFVVRSLDNPEGPPIAEVTIKDPPYEAPQVTVQPGNYETSVLVDGVVIDRDTIDLERGEDRWMVLRVLPPDVPRDCSDTPTSICERVIDAGYMWGLFPNGREVVTAVSVRPSRYSSCMAGVESPLYDVFFEVANPKGEMEATVGHNSTGRYIACTY